MDCGYFEQLIARMPDGELTDAELSALNAHIDGCAECRAFFHAMQAVREELTTLEDAPASLCGRVMDAVRQQAASDEPAVPATRTIKDKKRRWRFGDLGVLAACAALIVVVIGVTRFSPERADETASGPAMKAAAPAAGAEEFEAAAYAAPQALDDVAPLLGAAAPADDNGGFLVRSADEAPAEPEPEMPEPEEPETPDGAEDVSEILPEEESFPEEEKEAAEAEEPAEEPAAEAPELPDAGAQESAAAAEGTADVFDADGLFAGTLPPGAPDVLFSARDGESPAPADTQAGWTVEYGGTVYELFSLDGALYWRVGGEGQLTRAGMDEAEFLAALG